MTCFSYHINHIIFLKLTSCLVLTELIRILYKLRGGFSLIPCVNRPLLLDEKLVKK